MGTVRPSVVCGEVGKRESVDPVDPVDLGEGRVRVRIQRGTTGCSAVETRLLSIAEWEATRPGWTVHTGVDVLDREIAAAQTIVVAAASVFTRKP